MNLRPAGERALLVEVDDLETVHRLHAAVAALDPAGVTELVPGYRTLLVVADPAGIEVRGVSRRGTSRTGSSPTRYGNPGLKPRKATV